MVKTSEHLFYSFYREICSTLTFSIVTLFCKLQSFFLLFSYNLVLYNNQFFSVLPPLLFPPQPLVITIFLLISLRSHIFWTPQRTKIMWYLSFCAWLISHNIFIVRYLWYHFFIKSETLRVANKKEGRQRSGGFFWGQLCCC